MKIHKATEQGKYRGILGIKLYENDFQLYHMLTSHSNFHRLLEHVRLIRRSNDLQSIGQSKLSIGSYMKVSVDIPLWCSTYFDIFNNPSNCLSRIIFPAEHV